MAEQLQENIPSMEVLIEIMYKNTKLIEQRRVRQARYYERASEKRKAYAREYYQRKKLEKEGKLTE
jgi:hypothetical protein